MCIRDSLYGAHGTATKTRADGLSHECGAYCPFPAEAQALQASNHEELLEVLGEAAEEGEESKPEDSQLQHAHTADPVSQNACQPTAQR